MDLDRKSPAVIALPPDNMCYSWLKTFIFTGGPDKGPKNDERTTKKATVISGGQLRICWPPVSEGEFPIVDSLCNGNVDKVAQYDRTGNCLLCFVLTYLTERFSSTRRRMYCKYTPLFGKNSCP